MLQVVAFREEQAAATDLMRYRFLVPSYQTSFGQSLRLVGSLPALGRWTLDSAPSMQWHENHNWALEIELPRAVSFEFKAGVLIGPPMAVQAAGCACLDFVAACGLGERPPSVRRTLPRTIVELSDPA